VFTRACRLYLSWAKWIQSTLSDNIFLRSILILSFHLRIGLPSLLFPSGFPTKMCAFLSSSCVLHASPISSLFWFDCGNIWFVERVMLFSQISLNCGKFSIFTPSNVWLSCVDSYSYALSFCYLPCRLQSQHNILSAYGSDPSSEVISKPTVYSAYHSDLLWLISVDHMKITRHSLQHRIPVTFRQPTKHHHITL
jgi:hypothetical protein